MPNPELTLSVRRTLFGAAAVIFLLALLAATTGPARANWFGATGYAAVCPFDGNITDNKDLTFFYADASLDLSDATTWMRTSQLNPTELDTFSAAQQTSTTDIVMVDRYYTRWCEQALGVQWTTNGQTGLMGVTACYSITPNNRCQQQVVRISNHWLDTHGDAGDRWLVCHEVGHAIGLLHRDTGAGCMLNTGQVGAREYTAHDVDHFNGGW